MADADQPLAEIVDLNVPATLVRGHRLGTIVEVDHGRLWVDYQDNPHGPIEAPTTVALDEATARGAAQRCRSVLLAFLDERSDRPVVVGLLQDPIAPSDDSPEPASKAQGGFSASVDGNRVALEAKDEVVLRCGDASITLRRNGRLVIRGVFVETRARGVNRIKGGTVQIN